MFIMKMFTVVIEVETMFFHRFFIKPLFATRGVTPLEKISFKTLFFYNIVHLKGIPDYTPG